MRETDDEFRLDAAIKRRACATRNAVLLLLLFSVIVANGSTHPAVVSGFHGCADSSGIITATCDPSRTTLTPGEAILPRQIGKGNR